MANSCLLAGAGLSAAAALIHVGCIVFGPSWYRFLGAGEQMAQLAAAGHRAPTLITSGIAAVLAIWATYALSAAGVIARLPLLRTGLCVITGIYLLRGLGGLVLAAAAPGENGVAFWCWSSLICIGIAAPHLVGTRQVWPVLSRSPA
ncbi:MAG: hypothetical protein JNN30_07635 [Rhodanobacteraceae bacterium]|nr:hypothetical protein [Rhodanobacteraceae bacterium]